MTDSQEEHLASIQDQFFDWVGAKYPAGAKRHGGNLWDMSKEKLLDNAIDEAVDMVVYLLTLRGKK